MTPLFVLLVMMLPSFFIIMVSGLTLFHAFILSGTSLAVFLLCVSVFVSALRADLLLSSCFHFLLWFEKV